MEAVADLVDLARSVAYEPGTHPRVRPAARASVGGGRSAVTKASLPARQKTLLRSLFGRPLLLRYGCSPP